MEMYIVLLNFWFYLAKSMECIYIENDGGLVYLLYAKDNDIDYRLNVKFLNIFSYFIN